jgi:thiol-disulfide isomerase/thioredoxin
MVFAVLSVMYGLLEGLGMRLIRLVMLYAGLCIGANAVSADTGALIALAEGDLGKIRFMGTPEPVPSSGFVDADGAAVSMKDYRGKYVVLNFWALWCAPCREEMPALDRLQAQLGGATFEVVTVATGRNARPAVDKFFAEESLAHLPKLFDPKMTLARDFGALGLPVTVLIDPLGREIGRASGAVHWDSPAAIKLFQAWMAAG